MRKIQDIIDGMEPGEALAELTAAIKGVLGHLDEEARLGFVSDLIDDSGGDKVSSLVNL